MSLGAIFGRGATAPKAPPAGGHTPANGRTPGAPANGQNHRPGQDSPDDIAGNQMPPGKQKMTTGDKLGMAANIGMAGSMIVPMLPIGGGEKKKEGQPAPGQQPEGQHIEDPTAYKTNQVKTAVGPPPVNW